MDQPERGPHPEAGRRARLLHCGHRGHLAATAEQRFRQLFEQAPVALSTQRSPRPNPPDELAFTELFGYRLADTLTAADWQARVPTALGWKQLACLTAGRLHQRAPLVEQAVLCRDGSRKTVLLSRIQPGDERMLAAVD